MLQPETNQVEFLHVAASFCMLQPETKQVDKQLLQA
jgi:hypothetical protein